MSDEELIAEARKLLDGTTPGPWVAETLIGDDANGDECPTDVEIASQSGRHIHGHDLGYNDDVDAEIIANARFISASRELFPALLDALEAAESKLVKAVEALRGSRETILQLVNSRGSEAEGTDEDWVGDIDTTLAEIKSGVATTPYGLEGENHD